VRHAAEAKRYGHSIKGRAALRHMSFCTARSRDCTANKVRAYMHDTRSTLTLYLFIWSINFTDAAERSPTGRSYFPSNVLLYSLYRGHEPFGGGGVRDG
jgi:hypothetical protein